eukprot:CAMPEP_0181312760 /NCGR_PEP_ID=MMETSP1101-20121128/13870_1 /TAXON_ID=46948 /ORGANISM="Rhodomonas abbreviata, Strain Caron Lab Isolate" /LENGTH=69 /DNA_ID=CAMNT_0023419635 /DNA_START=474 /DNA_END=680 /DNA_ORIENTATION=-
MQDAAGQLRWIEVIDCSGYHHRQLCPPSCTTATLPLYSKTVADSPTSMAATAKAATTFSLELPPAIVGD